MREVPLRNHPLPALVDDADFERTRGYNWRLCKEGYVIALTGPSTKRIRHALHRIVMDAPDGLVVDHINHDKLDCRRGNLRLCSRLQNSYNRRHRADGASRFKGVSWNKDRRKWFASIGAERKNVYLGLFSDELSAARAYDEAALVLHGAFACLNFPCEFLGRMR